jgi:glutathione S-transferase fosA5
MTGDINHITFAVYDLDESLQFYEILPGFRLVARWNRGAYLVAGSSWICLSPDSNARRLPLPEYTHTAFSISADELTTLRDRITEGAIVEWQENRSEGESVYILDPNGHKLEFHCGDLQSRLEWCRKHPWPGMEFYE